MFKKEEENRLIDENDERRRTLSKKKMLIIFIIVSVILVTCLIITMIVSKRHKPKSDHHKNITKDLEKLGVPKNLTEFWKRNEKLCNVLTNSSNTEESNDGPSHIYILKVNRNLTDRQACGIESVLRLFPDKTIFLIDFFKGENLSCDKCSSPPNYLGLLLYLYKDRLQVVFAEKNTFLRDSPLQQFSKEDLHFDFLALLLTAYKYGGFVVTPDAVVSNRDLIECLPEETIVEPFVILSPKKCDDFLHYLMESFNLCGPGYNLTLEEMLSKSVELYGRAPREDGGSARRLTHQEVCVEPDRVGCTFLKLRRIEEDSKWVCDLSLFCRQVVQAFLGIRINQMEVEEETSKVKSDIASKKKSCKSRKPVTQQNNTCSN